MRSLGTQLRNLIEKLDSSVEQVYQDYDLAFKPRYYPVAIILDAHGPLSIKELSAKTGVSHSAMSQTITDMKKTGWLDSFVGEDRRQRKVDFSQNVKQHLPQLKKIWSAVDAAANELNQSLPTPLEETMATLNENLSQQSFYNRIKEQLNK